MTFEFDEYRVLPDERQLLRGADRVALAPKAFDLLLLLLEHNGQVLEKSELMRRLWPDTFVEEANLNVQISAIRKAFGESAQKPRYIATIPGRGYRLTADFKRRPIPLRPRAPRRFAIALSAAALLLLGLACALYVQREPQDHVPTAKAHEYYVTGRHFWNKRSADGLRRAIELYQKAIDEDPQYALPFAGLADAYSMLGDYTGRASGEYRRQAEAAAMKALELDDSLAETHATLAYLRMRSWDWSRVEKEFQRAIEINPRYASAHQWYSIFLQLQGREKEALAEANRAHELDPLSAIISESLASRLYFARSYDRALDQVQKTIAIEPSFEDAHDTLAVIYIQKRMWKEADEELTRSRSSAGTLGYAYAMSGREPKARAILAELESHPVDPVAIARIHSALGDRDRALVWLERAHRDHVDHLAFIRVDPSWDAMRSDPRFAAILRRIGLS